MAGKNRNDEGFLAPYTGETFGRWVVIAPRRAGSGEVSVLCRCACGTSKRVGVSALRRGKSLSCGCYRSEHLAEYGATHGRSRSPEYRAWAGMIQRCTNKSSSVYPRYGGRGIKVCEQWRRSFESFLHDMGERPSSKHSLDRVDNDGDYKPGNCRWANHKVQRRNQDQSRVRLVDCSDGANMVARDAAARYEISYPTLLGRLARGWDDRRALTTPPAECRRGVKYTYRGKSYTLQELSNMSGVAYGTLFARITRYGWSASESVEHKRKTRKDAGATRGRAGRA